MALDKSDVETIAHLARLQIDETKIPDYVSTLSSILDLVTRLQAVETDNVEPMAHPLDATQRLREDKVTETDRRDEYQTIAPDTEAGLYLVPKVIE